MPVTWIATVIAAVACWIAWTMAGEAIGMVLERMTRPVRRVLSRLHPARFMGVAFPIALGLTALGFYLAPSVSAWRAGLGLGLALGSVPSTLLLAFVVRDAQRAPPPTSSSDPDRRPL